MAIPISDKNAVVIEVDSRCFCCFRLPGSSSRKEKPNVVDDKVCDVFKKSVEEQKDPSVRFNRPRTVSFIG